MLRLAQHRLSSGWVKTNQMPLDSLCSLGALASAQKWSENRRCVDHPLGPEGPRGLNGERGAKRRVEWRREWAGFAFGLRRA